MRRCGATPPPRCGASRRGRGCRTMASEARLSAVLGGGARGAAPAPAGKHKYSAAFFGVDEADVASDFAEYRRRFGRFLT